MGLDGCKVARGWLEGTMKSRGLEGWARVGVCWIFVKGIRIGLLKVVMGRVLVLGRVECEGIGLRLYLCIIYIYS